MNGIRLMFEITNKNTTLGGEYGKSAGIIYVVSVC